MPAFQGQPCPVLALSAGLGGTIPSWATWPRELRPSSPTPASCPDARPRARSEQGQLGGLAQAEPLGRCPQPQGDQTGTDWHVWESQAWSWRVHSTGLLWSRDPEKANIPHFLVHPIPTCYLFTWLCRVLVSAGRIFFLF